MVKKLSLIALLLLVIGIGGSIYTGKSQFKEVEKLEDKVIKDSQFEAVDIYTDNAKVIIKATDDKYPKIELEGNNKKYDLKTGVLNHTLSVDLTSRGKKLFSFGIFSKQSTLTVHIPQKTYEQIRIKSNNGRIHVKEIKGVKIEMLSDNGRIQARQMEGEEVFAKSNNGRIELEDIAAQMIKPEADNGRINMKYIEGEIIGKSYNGKINLVTKEMNHPINLSSDNGKIEIKTDKKPTNAILDLKTDNGKVTVFGEENWDTVIGKGEHLIKLISKNGKISITE